MTLSLLQGFTLYTDKLQFQKNRHKKNFPIRDRAAISIPQVFPSELSILLDQTSNSSKLELL